MRPWAAARPRDRHTRACGSEWSISKPGQALPPPTGAAARLSSPCGSTGASRQQGLRVLLECSARLCRRPWAPRPGLVVPPVPLVPSKQQGIGVSSRSMARPCRRPRAPRPGPVVHEVPPAPSRQQGLRVLLECSARLCCRPRAPRPGPAVPPVPLAPSRQQGLRVLLECSARLCCRPRAPQSGRAVCTARHVPRFSLFLSGVTPLSGALHQLGGGVMPPNWCNPP